jgi:hypothetical protein
LARDSVESCQIIGNDDEDEPIAGIIEKISLKNFKCHARLEMTLSKRTTFVTGRNGSSFFNLVYFSQIKIDSFLSI